ncbi:helix-turn-helix domain-containing protein [Novosphingobium sp. KA1]|uniref:helix-turn-helix domain-containing protein n=1 Tax=Novosphingobium sp. (strain KA1) TaxID=164608 RepID=UPI001A907EF9|nr:helix-turn-helix domain-containing protein [Novosphingobium sp. KA1]QSR16158.1 Fis family transcriptional regulator [Novosphingobium sp. KA1]
MASDKLNHSDQVMHTVQQGNAAAVSAVAASWCRSALHHGLDPAASRKGERIGGTSLTALRENSGELIAAATPALDHLFGSVGRTGCCVILSNIDGVVIEARTGASDVALFDSIGLAPGGQWGEAAEGTNGIGTCLVEQRPVTILRGEHFASRNIGVSCMDAPVFDPEGRLVAALDVSSARADHGEAMATMIAALVQDAARQIERDYFCMRYADARIVYSPDRQGSVPRGRGISLLAVDRDDLVIGATRAARLSLRLGTNPFDRPRPLADVMGDSSSSFDDSERAILRQALARSGGNVTRAARDLGIGRATMYRRMERVGIAPGQ